MGSSIFVKVVQAWEIRTLSDLNAQIVLSFVQRIHASSDLVKPCLKNIFMTDICNLNLFMLHFMYEKYLPGVEYVIFYGISFFQSCLYMYRGICIYFNKFICFHITRVWIGYDCMDCLSFIYTCPSRYKMWP